MEINMMTWNTQLYEYGTKDKDTGRIKKTFADAPVEEVKKIITNHMESNNNPIVVLQEIPFKRKNESNHNWEYNSHFREMTKFFEDNEYDYICLDCNDKWHIKMTMVVSKKGLLIEHPYIEKNNIFVPFIIKDKDVSVLAVHAHNAFELIKWVKENSYRPNIIIGDFNAGNYIKSKKDYEIEVNRVNYQMLSTGYLDVCQGKYTTNYPEPTQIDHILIENSFEFNKRFTVKRSEVDSNVSISDHYPIYCKLEIE